MALKEAICMRSKAKPKQGPHQRLAEAIRRLKEIPGLLVEVMVTACVSIGARVAVRSVGYGCLHGEILHRRTHAAIPDSVSQRRGKTVPAHNCDRDTRAELDLFTLALAGLLEISLRCSHGPVGRPVKVAIEVPQTQAGGDRSSAPRTTLSFASTG